jgi:glutamate synthase (NADPH/NADH) large chain
MQHFDLSAVLDHHIHLQKAKRSTVEGKNAPFDKGLLAEKMVAEMLPAIEGKLVDITLQRGNCDRSIGARIVR